MRGKSAVLDPQRFAVRRDLADIRLADRVFAPHYAAASLRIVTTAADLRDRAEPTSTVLGEVSPGDTFEVLEFFQGRAWGCAPRLNLVGYVDAEALSGKQA